MILPWKTKDKPQIHFLGMEFRDTYGLKKQSGLSHEERGLRTGKNERTSGFFIDKKFHGSS